MQNEYKFYYKTHLKILKLSNFLKEFFNILVISINKINIQVCSGLCGLKIVIIHKIIFI